LTQQIAAVTRERDALRGQLKDEEEKSKTASADVAGLYSALNDYESAFEGAFDKSTAKCQDDLKALYRSKLSGFAPWCKDARSFEVKEEQCAPQLGGSAEAPTLTCTETAIIHLKDGDKPPVTAKKTFQFSKSKEGGWRVSGWQ
jgi:hypothetical protein